VKALLYKEFRLAMHPMCYVFVLLFPFMTLIPSFPLGVGFIYLLTAYPILFLGANKGQQSNDLLFSTLLPVRKKDIVLARIFTVIIMQLTYVLIMSALLPLAQLIQSSLASTSSKAPQTPGFTVNASASLLGFGIIGFALADLIFFPIYYKNGRSIVLSTLLTILGFVLYLAIFTLILPLALEGYRSFFTDTPWIQWVFLGGAIALSAGLHLVTYHVAARRLERVDF